MNTEINRLLAEQIGEWELLCKNNSELKSVETKSFNINGSDIKLQFNPARITSSSAKVDKESIKKRKCFLCAENRPEVQRGVDFENDFTILANPFPIFNSHFTIPHKDHTLQLIKPYVADMLKLSKSLNDFTIFYNGPKCGASAPDHMHFQAGEKGFMTIDNQYEDIKEKHTIDKLVSDNASIYFINDGLRKIISIESCSIENTEIEFNKIYSVLSENQAEEDEPMMNVITSYQDDTFRVLIFPRKSHRPRQFFEEGDNQVMFSPGSVDFGGVCIFPRQKDFEKMDEDLLIDMFSQLTIDSVDFEKIYKKIR